MSAAHSSEGRIRAKLGPWALVIYGILAFAFLYLPIIIVVIFSFNDSRSVAQWSGFTLNWYRELIADDQILLSLWNSLFVAIISTVIATVLGTLAALGLERYSFRGKLVVDSAFYLPIIIPDIAMAIMLLIFFNISGIGFEPWRVSFVGVRLAVPYSVIIGHVAFNIAFVTVVVRGTAGQHGHDAGRSRQRSLRQLLADLSPRHPADADAGHTGRRAAGLHPVAGRLRHHLFHQRRRLQHTAGARLRHDQARRDAGDQRRFDVDAGGILWPDHLLHSLPSPQRQRRRSNPIRPMIGGER